MQKEILLEVVKQNQFTSHFSLDQVSAENASLRLNDKQHLSDSSTGILERP